MPTGLKSTSSPIVVSQVYSAGAGFASLAVDLQLNPLDNEVFVVTAIDFSWNPENTTDWDLVQGAQAAGIFCTVSTTKRATVGTIGASNVIAGWQINPYSPEPSFTEPQPVGTRFATAYSEQLSGNTPPANMDYLAIIATSDFFINSDSYNMVDPQACAVRLYGYRAQASASQYAALVQSEVLSN